MMKSDIGYLNVQQTPKPEAQFPSIVPLFELHSDLVKQVPMSPLDFPVHMLKESKLISELSHITWKNHIQDHKGSETWQN